MNDIISRYKPLVDEALKNKLKFNSQLYSSVIDAMNYSVSIGGKRIRPCILLEFSRILGGDFEKALDMACALEMIHTYSLIHDDLPCMDNDDMRRGNPSCHIKYGEDIALLAGDALLTEAFFISSNVGEDKAENTLKCINILSSCAGVNGMIGGQVIDLESENKKVDLKTLEKLNALKTSKLLEAAAMLGCIVSGAEDNKVLKAKEYGYNLGIAFQIVDDILDINGDSALLGKPIGSDSENNKSTFVSLLGMERAAEMASQYTERAINALEVFGEEAKGLKELTLELLSRNH